jgi:O-antigen ligase
MLNINRQSSAFEIKPLEGLFFFLIIIFAATMLTTQYYILSVLPALAILGMFFIIKYPKFCFYTIIFMIPFDAFRSGAGILKFLTVSKIFGIALFALALFQVFIKRDKSVNIGSNMWVWLLLFFTANFFSSLISDYRLVAFDSIRQHITLFIVFLLTLVFVSEKGLFKTLPLVIIISTGLNAVLSIIGFFFQIPLLSMNLKDSIRATGLANDPNFFASMLLFSLPLIADRLFSDRKLSEKIMAALLLLSVITAIILSYSRAAAGVMLLVMLFIAIQHIRKFRIRHIGFAGLLLIFVIVIGAAVVPESYWQRQKSVADVSDPSIGRRITYTYVAWDIFKEHPVMGVGPGVFKEYYAQSPYAVRFADDMTEQLKRYAHNTYIEVLTGSGLAGLLFFLIIHIAALRNLGGAARLFRMKKMNEKAAIVRAYQWSYITIMVYFFFVSNVYHKYFWLPVALSEIALRFARQTSKGEGDEIAVR